ncbi:MAG TPA: serine hydrolase [Marinilabiliales bacterium]|nr:MAG: serine hydrolase [Bacteroidetes bacterium GWC2_40_13]OFX73432.1 MAG: serine hydrolase [Bacteroidetes bacterium GWD2_40_43]OFX94790.1 MAG: serine hydrolase [Bacteroidetes bacterium GWE2_40_63]OFY24799.1 MAG: serine hydrolase [Bacteroidetes bacterium GWF2_40_13]OFZ24036.1 MAG: serine hydrolase [Bacteroidetes bacterium RIFOXYC2_FULL_40_12]HAM98511.1 serine hydrolase [Marinilabiliales bacterium]
MKKTTKRLWIALVVVFVIAVYVLMPGYTWKALVYQKVGIDDYPIFYNREISTGTPQEWPTNNKLQGFRLDDSTLNAFNELQTIAFLVIKNGSIIFEQYWDGYGANSQTNSFSMAKSIIGLLVGAAMDDGYIQNLDQPVADFIDSYRNAENQGLTIRHLLTMSSGLNWDESYGSLFSTTTEAYYGKDINKLIYSLKMVEKPGVEFKYLSGNTQLLATIVEKATGKKVGDYAAEKFWKPMGAVNPALWCLDRKDGMEKAYCCFNSNARDFARWGQLVLNQGVWKGDTLISPEYVRLATQPANNLMDETGNAIDYYGYQWWIQHLNGEPVPYMRGILGQYVFVIPSQNAVVVRLGHLRSEDKKNHHPMDTYLYLETAEKILKEFELR